MNVLRNMILAAAALLTAIPAFSQSSLPAPGGMAGGGRGGNSMPAPGGMAAGAAMGGAWGSPWGAAPIDLSDTGTVNVLGCGYDAQGVWRVIPMKVAYQYNGLQYNVTVMNAWNPWSDMWNYGVDQPAYNTSYYINGNNYNFYAPLSTGTYYFNL